MTSCVHIRTLTAFDNGKQTFDIDVLYIMTTYKTLINYSTSISVN